MGALRQLGLWAIFAATLVFALPEDRERRRKAIGIFNIVKFDNEACISSTSGRNGTCYTSEECSSRSGVSSGSCADGYGVCCVISLECGGTSSENNTYMEQAASTSPSVSPAGSGSCTFTICPSTSSINRIRLDLTTFSIASPVGVADTNGDAGAASLTTNAAVGHCMTDTFDVSGAPTICGSNAGQHMIVDTDGTDCITASFSFSGSTDSRSYTIGVTQYDSSNSLSLAGPAGCLQHYIGNSGTVKTFNWLATGLSTHLANQHYNVCVRQAVGMCYICWAGATGGANIVGTFGLSNGAAGIAGTGESGVDATCANQDYVTIPGALTVANPATTNAATTLNAAIAVGVNRLCGRHLAGTSAAVADVTVCTKRTPFIMGVHTDLVEVATAMGAMANNNEASDGTADSTYNNAPLGTIGFQLGFEQITC